MNEAVWLFFPLCGPSRELSDPRNPGGTDRRRGFSSPLSSHRDDGRIHIQTQGQVCANDLQVLLEMRTVLVLLLRRLSLQGALI